METIAAFRIIIPFEVGTRYSNPDGQIVCNAPYIPRLGKLQEVSFSLPLARSPRKLNDKIPTVRALPFCSITDCSSTHNHSLKSDWLILQVESLFFGVTVPIEHYPSANFFISLDKRVQAHVITHHCVSHYGFDEAIWVLMSVQSLAQ